MQAATGSRLSIKQIAEFEETGLLHLPGAIADADTLAMRERLWQALEQHHQILRDAPETWAAGRISKLQEVEKAGAFAPMASPVVLDALDCLFGSGQWSQPPRWGSPLVTLPMAGAQWQVPHQHWHVDLDVDPSERAPRSVIVFAFLESIGPGGGGTAAVTGSHQLLRRLAGSKGNAAPVRSADARRLLARSGPWARGLWSENPATDRVRRLMHQGAVLDGIPLRVREIASTAGDVVVMHPCVLHAPAMNCGSTPRLTLRQPILRNQ